jgi:hypothetical protein
MRKKYAKWIDFLYGPLFRVIGFFYRIYTSNRARYERFKANQAISTVLKAATVLLLMGWILIWLFASDDNRTRLEDEVRQTIGGFDADTEQ